MSFPLTQILMKSNFNWIAQADGTFHNLKTTLSMPPVSILLDFSKEFIIKMMTVVVKLEQFYCKWKVKSHITVSH